MRVPGHNGPHPEIYHQYVYDRLVVATDGLEGEAYNARLQEKLKALREEAGTSGSPLDKLLTKTE